MTDHQPHLGKPNSQFAVMMIAIFATTTMLLSACNSRPPTIRPINIDAGDTAKLAIEKYDADSDGELSADELQNCAAIQKSLTKIDTDGNGNVSQSEMEQRLLQWQTQKMGIRSLKVAVTMNGQPLTDADVEFQPEAFMGDIAKPAFGFTDEYGVANMSHNAEDMPKGAEGVRGVTNGFFRIKITHPDKAIPAKYNEETVLGKEVAMDTINSVMTIDL